MITWKTRSTWREFYNTRVYGCQPFYVCHTVVFCFQLFTVNYTKQKCATCVELYLLLRSINYSLTQITALNQLIKHIPLNAGSGASLPCSFACNAMFSSLFAMLELGGRCAA